MFLLNSHQGLFAATPKVLHPLGISPSRALLLPKLRSQIAEFLKDGYLVRLGTLIPVHQCRFAVRTPLTLATKIFLPV